MRSGEDSGVVSELIVQYSVAITIPEDVCRILFEPTLQILRKLVAKVLSMPNVLPDLLKTFGVLITHAEPENVPLVNGVLVDLQFWSAVRIAVRLQPGIVSIDRDRTTAEEIGDGMGFVVEGIEVAIHMLVR